MRSERAAADLAVPDARPLVFASGSNEPGEIRGFTSLGIPVGVSAAEIGIAALAELEALAGTGLPVFVDQGACREVSADPVKQLRAGLRPRPGVLLVLREITSAGWDVRLGVQEHIVRHLGARAHVVAPDRVGDQAESLRRFRLYGARVARMADAGAVVLVPLQLGVRSLEDFHDDAAAALGGPGIPAFPLSRGGVQPTDVLRYVRARRPPALHLLGVGPRGRRTPALLRSLAALSPALHVSMDANLTAAAVGRRGGTVRPLTRAQDAIRAEGYAHLSGAVVDDAWGIYEDCTERISVPSEWLGPTRLRRVAERANLPGSAVARFVRDPDGFLQEEADRRGEGFFRAMGDAAGSDCGPAWWQDPLLEAALLEAYEGHLERQHTSPRKAAAIRTVFHNHPAAEQFAPPDPRRVARVARAARLRPHRPRGHSRSGAGLQRELPL